MTTPSAEDIELLLCVLRGDHSGAARALAARRASLDTFVDFVSARGLSVVCLGALEGSPVRSALSPHGIAWLEEKRRRQIARADKFLAELERLAERFDAAGLRFVLLKGPYLAARFYGDLYGREFLDLDLLVHMGDREHAFALLAAAGYRAQSRVILDRRLTCYFVHGFDFAREGVQVDLHWCLSRHPSFHIDE